MTVAVNSAPVGSLIVVFCKYITIADTLSGVVDSAGNTYILLENFTGTGIGLGIAYCEGSTVNLPIGGTITATFAGATNNAISAAVVSGIALSGSIDKHNNTAQGVAATTTGAVTTGTLAQSDEVAFMYVPTTAGAGGFTPAAGFTALAGASAVAFSVSYDVVAVNTSISNTTTWVNSVGFVADLITFKAPAAALPAGTVYDLSIPRPSRYPMENRGFIHDTDVQLIGKDLTPKFNAEWKVPPPRSYPIENRSFIHDTDIQLIAKDTVPNFTADLSLPAPRRYPMELRGFIHDTDTHLIGKDQIPYTVPDWRVPPPKPRSRALEEHLNPVNRPAILTNQDLFFPGPAVATPPTTIGTANNVASGVGFATAISANAGDQIVVFAGFGAIAGESIVSITDSAGNTYSNIATSGGSTAAIPGLQMYLNTGTSLALPSGSTITVTTTLANAYTAVALAIKGLIVTPTDGVTNVRSASIKNAVAPLTKNKQVQDLALGAVAIGADPGVFTEAPNYTSLPGISGRVADPPNIFVAYMNFTDGLGFQYTPSWANLADMGAIAATFRVRLSPHMVPWQSDIPLPRLKTRTVLETQSPANPAWLIVGNEILPGFSAEWKVPPPARRQRGLEEPLNQYPRIVGQERLPGFVADLRQPPPARRAPSLVETSAPANPAWSIVGQETLPGFVAEWRIPPERPRLRDLIAIDWQTYQSELLIGQETLPIFAYDLRTPQGRAGARDALTIAGQPDWLLLWGSPVIVQLPFGQFDFRIPGSNYSAQLRAALLTTTGLGGGPVPSTFALSAISFFGALTEWDEDEPVNPNELVAAREFLGITQVKEA